MGVKWEGKVEGTEVKCEGLCVSVGDQGGSVRMKEDE